MQADSLVNVPRRSSVAAGLADEFQPRGFAKDVMFPMERPLLGESIENICE